MTNNLPKAIIVDLDDCLFDSRPLNQYFPKDEKSREEWDFFQSKVSECGVNGHIKELIKSMIGFSCINVIFLTSREARKEVVKETKAAIESLIPDAIQNHMRWTYSPSYQLFMRAEEDYRPSEEVKRDLYNSCVKDRYDVLFAIDDCPKNIKMFKSLGINTLRCEYGKGK